MGQTFPEAGSSPTRGSQEHDIFEVLGGNPNMTPPIIVFYCRFDPLSSEKCQFFVKKMAKNPIKHYRFCAPRAHRGGSPIRRPGGGIIPPISPPWESMIGTLY